MKKSIRIFIIGILSLAATEVKGQVPDKGVYELKVNFSEFINTGNEMKNIEFEVYTEVGGDKQLVINQRVGTTYNGRSVFYPQYIPSQPYYTYMQPQRPTEVKFFERRTKPNLGRTTSRYWTSYPLDPNNPSIYVTLDGGWMFPNCQVKMELWFRPAKIGIGYLNPQGVSSTDNFLPEDNPITLKATPGFIAATYKWEYSLDGGPWTSFPASILNRSAIKSTITFKGKELCDSDEDIFRTYFAGKNLSVRINTATTDYPTSNGDRETIILLPCLSAPRVTGFENQIERCNGDGGTVKLFFDRALLTGEVFHLESWIEVAQAFQIYQRWDNINMEAGNMVTISGLAAKTYKFAAATDYNGRLSWATPSGNILLPERPAIVYEITPKHISCHGGSDGEITVQAIGGTGSYTAILYKTGMNDPIQEISFSNQDGVFTRLLPGNYSVSIFVTNNCTPTNNNLTATLTEPAAPVSVEVEYFEPPLGYYTHNGWLMLKVVGGTQSTGGRYDRVGITHETYGAMSPGSISNDGSEYTFIDLARGVYSITVRDRNYNIPLDDADRCGCNAVMTFDMPSPPPLEVALEQTRIIRFYGGKEGELTAHATGGVRFAAADAPNRRPYVYTWQKQTDTGLETIDMPNDSIASGLAAGFYHLIITDKNKITTTADYQITQPTPLQVSFNTVQAGCYGTASGGVTATVSGGTPPYGYKWNVEGATGNALASIEAGKYQLLVMDALGAQLSSTVEVPSASSLKVASGITQPSCTALGTIRLTELSGGSAPYTLKWYYTSPDAPERLLATNQGVTPFTASGAPLLRDELMPGDYKVIISDVANCANAYSFSLKEPRGFSVSLGGDLAMCRDQSRVVAAASKEPDLSYAWYLDDVRLPGMEDQILVDKEGVYKVVATNPQGCTATDEITVKITRETLDLEMTAPTTIEVGSEIHAVNLSTMSADRIDWKVPEGATIIKQSDMELVFSLANKGSYTVSMEGFKGEGATIVTRTVTVVGKGEVDLPEGDPLIKQFWVTPNPSTGYFQVVVDLDRQVDFTMLLYSPAGDLMDTKQMQGVQSKTFEYEINGILQGTYILKLITKTDTAVLQIVIKK